MGGAKNKYGDWGSYPRLLRGYVARVQISNHGCNPICHCQRSRSLIIWVRGSNSSIPQANPLLTLEQVHRLLASASMTFRMRMRTVMFYVTMSDKKALLTPRAARDSAPWWIGIQYRHLAENCVFFIPFSYSAPPLPIFPVEFGGEVKRQETRVMGLLCGEGCVILTSTVFDWSIRVTDGRTGDGI